jgi:hypothetical protein
MKASNATPATIFYHGTNASFKTFDKTKKGSNTGYRNTVHGFFFADKIENALLFGQTIITATLDIKNPVDFRLQSIFTIESQASIIWEILTGEILPCAEALNTLNEQIGLGEIGDLWEALNTEEAGALLMERGYDSIISSLGNEQNEYTVFSADQTTYFETFFK